VAEVSLTTVVLAGGRATRLPGKLARPMLGVPLLARVYANVRDVAPVVIAAREGFPPELDALLDCPIVLDRWPNRGPLAGLIGALSRVATTHVFALAGDAPNVTREVPDALIAACSPEDEAVVPEHDERLEPLAAVYERAALEREGRAVLREEKGSMHALLARLRVRRLVLPSRYFANVNTAADFEAVAQEMT
jgi:molybdenum cofactor guanylyltransferase